MVAETLFDVVHDQRGPRRVVESFFHRALKQGLFVNVLRRLALGHGCQFQRDYHPREQQILQICVFLFVDRQHAHFNVVFGLFCVEIRKSVIF